MFDREIGSLEKSHGIGQTPCSYEHYLVILSVIASLLKQVINSLILLVLIVIPLLWPNAPDGQKITKMSHFNNIINYRTPNDYRVT